MKSSLKFPILAAQRMDHPVAVFQSFSDMDHPAAAGAMPVLIMSNSGIL
jgi:hypothetical protein